MKPKLGQNFLADESVLEFEAESAQVRGKSVLEIGAGDGRLTAKLLAEGAGHVIAIEIDPKLARSLRMRFHKRVKVIEGDFLDYEPQARFNAVVGNIPYCITSPILFKLSKMDFEKAVLCLQKEVALRMAAQPGSANYGRLSVFSQLCFAVEVLALVPKEAFSPKPKVDSCIISLVPTGMAMDEEEERVLGAIFAHRKKSLRNAVIDARMELFGSNDKKAAADAAQKVKYAERKVFTLSPNEALEAARRICALGRD